jgi:hypothetical protein
MQRSGTRGNASEINVDEYWVLTGLVRLCAEIGDDGFAASI